MTSEPIQTPKTKSNRDIQYRPAERGYRARHRLARACVFVATLLLVAPVSADWPQWGGPTRNFVVADAKLSDQWPEDGLKAKWRRDLGEGYSQILVVGDRLFVHYRNGDDEIVAALSADTGESIWEYKYAAALDPNDKSITLEFGQGPNATPLYVDGRLYTLGFKGLFHCLDATSGKVVWSHDMAKEFDTKIPYFGHATSPIRHKDNVILIAGGATSFNLNDGTETWRNRDFNGSYASPMIEKFDGVPQMIAFVEGEIVGVNPDSGKTLWRVAHANQWKTNLFTPVIGDDATVFLSAKDVGARMLKITPDGPQKAQAKELWLMPKLQFNFSNAIRAGEYLYGSVGDAAGHVIAVQAKTGEVSWRDRAMKNSNFIRTGNRYLIFDDEGLLALASLSPEKITVHAKTQLLDDRCWTAPSLVGKTLYVRDRKEIAAIQLP